MPERATADRDEASKDALDWVIRINADPDDVAAREALARWLANSDDHVDAYRRASAVWQLTGDPALPFGIANDRPAPKFEQSGKRSENVTYARGRRRPLALGVCAVAILAFVAIFSPRLWIAFNADYATGTAETRHVALSDGSEIDINADSAIAVNFSAAARRITLLRGEIYIAVAHSELRSLEVQAGPVSAISVGTAYDVAMHPGSTNVTVSEGQVRVVGGSADRGVLQQLSAGQRVSINWETGEWRLSTAAPTQVGGVAWRGVSSSRGCPSAKW